MIPTVDFQFGTCIDTRLDGFARCRRVEIIRRGRWVATVAMIVKRTEKSAWELHLGATHPAEVGPPESADHTERVLRDMYSPVAEVLW